MKKFITLAIICVLGLTGCSKTGEEKWDMIPMVMVDGTLYLDTGYTNTDIRKCGTPDGEITSTVEGTEKPVKDNQSNFGSGYGYQYGATEGTIEIYMNDTWRIFATEEVKAKVNQLLKVTSEPGTLPEVSGIPQPDQSEVTSIGTYSFDIFDVTSFAYFYNQKSKEERLVLVGGAGKYAQLLILETDFKGAAGLKNALNESFQAKLLAYKNISFEEGQYAYNASLAVGCADEERIDLKSEFKNETENQMYFGNVRSSYPEYPSDAMVTELDSGRFVMMASNVKEEESEGLQKNKEIYERIFERFGLEEIVSVDDIESKNESEVHSSNISRIEVNSLLYEEYNDLMDEYWYEPKYNAAQWMNEAGELLFPYEQELNNDTKMADDLALLYKPDEILLKASTEDLLKVVMDGWLETNATSISAYSIPSHYIRSCTIKNQAANELMRRSDMVTVLYEDYCNRNYLKGEESREGRWAADKLQFDEIILASNHAFAMMDDEMKENVLNAALEKYGQVRSGYFYTVGHTSGFFAYIVEEELNGGSDWYQYIHDNNIEAAKNAISFNETCWLEQFY